MFVSNVETYSSGVSYYAPSVCCLPALMANIRLPYQNFSVIKTQSFIFHRQWCRRKKVL